MTESLSQPAKEVIKVAFAESCTGGLVCSLVTDYDGSSEHVLGSCVSYAQPIKVKHLGVDDENSRKNNCVDFQTGEEMVWGVMDKWGAHLAVSVTGYVGANEDMSGPYCWITVGVDICDERFSVSEKFCLDKEHYRGKSRHEIKEMFAKRALFNMFLALMPHIKKHSAEFNAKYKYPQRLIEILYDINQDVEQVPKETLEKMLWRTCVLQNMCHQKGIDNVH